MYKIDDKYRKNNKKYNKKYKLPDFLRKEISDTADDRVKHNSTLVIENTDFSYLIFEHFDFTNTVFKNCNFSNCEFYDCFIFCMDLNNCDFSNSKFQYCCIKWLTNHNVNFSNSIFKYCKNMHRCFYQADTTNIELENCDLSNISLNNPDSIKIYHCNTTDFEVEKTNRCFTFSINEHTIVCINDIIHYSNPLYNYRKYKKYTVEEYKQLDFSNSFKDEYKNYFHKLSLKLL